jgi:hypothetical protein
MGVQGITVLGGKRVRIGFEDKWPEAELNFQKYLC